MAARKIKYGKNSRVGSKGITYLKEVKPSKSGNRRALFKCLCGNEWEYNISKIKADLISSCGCTHSRKEPININTEIGKHGVTFIKDIHYKKQRRGEFRCKCGNIFTARLANVKNNSVKSCGCLLLSVITTHGLAKHPLYLTHFQMVYRCHNIKNQHLSYMKRGIVVEEYLKNLTSFIDYFETAIGVFDIKTRKFIKVDGWSIDRIDNNKGYKRGNLRWATVHTQTSNRKCNHFYVGVQKNGVKYLSYIRYKEKAYHLGTFNTSELALEARNKFIIKNKFPHNLQKFKEEK